MVRSQLLFTLAFLAGFVEFLAPVAFAEPTEKENANAWAKAEVKIEAHLKGIDPKMRYAEFKSERLSKYLPEYRVFVGFERNAIGQWSLFIVNKDGEITDLDDDDQEGISTFLCARKIQVKTPEDAIEFAKFFKELQGSQNYIASLYINTKGFTVFDKRFIEYYSGERADTDWKHTSEKREGGWKVSVTYVGNPSGSIILPPRNEIDVDEQGNFRGLKEVRGP